MSRLLSRRVLSRRGVLLSKATTQDSLFTPADYLEAAKQAARWINASAAETPDGIGWLPEPDDSAKTVTVSSPLTIYSGNAGIVLFLFQLAQVTQQDEYLQKAKRGADLLAKQWPSVATFKSGLLSSPYSFYNGLSGVAFTLLETWKATGEQRYRDADLETFSSFMGLMRGRKLRPCDPIRSFIAGRSLA